MRLSTLNGGPQPQPFTTAALLLLTGVGFVPSIRWAAPTITITGTDYAFQIPTRVRAGATLLAFENHGTVRHEMSVALLKVGLAPDSVLQAITRGTRRRDFVEGQAALIIAAPGEPSGPRLWLNLQKGRTYVVLCTLRDSPDQPQHTSLGMIGSFRPD